jgi:hypothetical protein
MAFRRPLYLDGTNALREMNDTQITECRTFMYWEYIKSPSITLSSRFGVSLGTVYDTRLRPGEYRTNAIGYVPESKTQEPQIIQLESDAVYQELGYADAPDNDDNNSFPLYYTTGGDLRAMNLTDMLDTFAEPTITELIKSDAVYTIQPSNTLSGYTNRGEVFSDLASKPAADYGTGIPVEYSLSEEVGTYYLLQRNYSAPNDPSVQPVVFSQTDTNPVVVETEPMGELTWQFMLSDLIKYTARNHTGWRIRYNFNGSGASCGAIIDKRLNGSGKYITKFVNANDYRSQEVPNGSLAEVNRYTLKVERI